MIPEQPIDNRFPGATVPRGERRHAARPRPAHRLPRRYRAAAPRSHRRRRRDRPMARALRWAPAHQGWPHGRSDDTGGRRPRRATARTPPQHERAGDPVALPLRDRHGPRRHLPARRPNHRAPGQLRAASVLGDIRDTLLHEIARAIVGPGHAHDAVWRTAARRIGCTAKRCSTVPHSLKRWNRGVPAVPGPVFRHHLTARVRQRLDLPAAGLARHLEESTPTGKAAGRGNARARLPRLPAGSDDRPDGHRHRQTRVRGPAPPPRAGGCLDPPSHPC